MERNSKIFVAGHRGLVGSTIVKTLLEGGFNNIVYKTRIELDLLDQASVKQFFESERPEYVFLAAAKVGGIMANDTHPAEFIYENLSIQSNIIHSAHITGVKKLLFLGSSCIYPKMSPQPIKEEYLLTGALEPTNEAYAIAKIAGLKMCESYKTQYGADFISAMPSNLYGPNDNFDLESSHVIPAMIRKFHEAKESNSPTVTLWGTGKAKREFLYVDDLASACLHLIQHYSAPKTINVGTGKDISIKELAELIKETVGFEGGVTWDSSKPDGTPRKLLDVSKIENLGWKAGISLKEGLSRTYAWYKETLSK